MICIGPHKTKIQLEAVLKTEYQHYYSLSNVRIKLSEQIPMLWLDLFIFLKSSGKNTF